MRIISSFKDYYDNAVSYGIDPKQVYIRDQKQVIIDHEGVHKELVQCIRSWKMLLNKINIDYSRLSFPNFHYGVIGFCGKLYPYYSFSTHNENMKTIVKTYYSYEAMNKAANSDYCVELFGKNEAEGMRKFADELIKTKYFSTPHTIVEFEEMYNEKYIGDEAFRVVNSPIFEFTNSQYSDPKYDLYKHRVVNTRFEMTVNPSLKVVNFISKFDPVSAFQEIQMYVGNNLVQQVDPTINHSDELKAEIHGFDKMSFRKEKKK